MGKSVVWLCVLNESLDVLHPSAWSCIECFIISCLCLFVMSSSSLFGTLLLYFSLCQHSIFYFIFLFVIISSSTSLSSSSSFHHFGYQAMSLRHSYFQCWPANLLLWSPHCVFSMRLLLENVFICTLKIWVLRSYIGLLNINLASSEYIL